MKRMLITALMLAGVANAQVYNYFPPPGITYSSTGGMALGSASAMGIGTLDAQGLYVNGTPVTNYPQTAAEAAASITPVNYNYPSCWIPRYEVNTTPGVTDMSAAFADAQTVCSAAFVPAGTYKMGLTVSTNNFSIQGEEPTGNASGGTKLIPTSLTTSAITVGNVSGFSLQNVLIISATQQTSGALLDFEHSINSYVTNVEVDGGYDNVKIANVGILRWNGGQIRDFSHRAIYVTGSTGVQPGGGDDIYIHHIIIDEDNGSYTPLAAINVDQNGGSITLDDDGILHGHNDLLVNPGAGQYVDWLYATNTYFDSCDYGTYGGGSGIDFAPTSTGIINGGSFANDWASTCTINVNLNGVSTSTLSGLKLTNMELLNAGKQAFYSTYATDVVFSNSVIGGASQSAFNTYAGIDIDTGSDHFALSNIRSGATVEGYTATAKFDLAIEAGFTGHLSVTGGDYSGAVTANSFLAAAIGTPISIVNATGINPMGPLSLTPGASQWTYTAGFTQETLFVTGSGLVSCGYSSGSVPVVSNSCAVPLAPGQSVQVTYTGSVTSFTNRQ